jgi:hypothetical protein
MKGAALPCGVVFALVCALAGMSGAAEVAVTDNDRLVRNFTREAATVGDGRIRLEVRGFLFEDDENVSLDLLGFPVKEIEREVDSKRGIAGSQVRSVRGGTIDLLGSYGLGSSAEVGFDVPFHIMETRFRPPCSEDDEQPCDPSPTQVATRNEEDMGDVLLYGKFKRAVAERCWMAAGLELSIPTGIEDKRFGTGETGLNPFISSRYQRGRFALGAHVGYFIYTGPVDDVFNYSVQALARGSALYVIRAELSGRLFKAGGTQFNDVVVLPGIDFNLTENFTIRPTGVANITDEAVDWGLGIGLALQL